MCSKKLDQEVSELYALVSKLDPDAPGSCDFIIETVETSHRPRPQKKPSNIKPPKPPPPTPPPNLLQRSFSFTGTLSRAYFAKNTATLIMFSGLVVIMIDVSSLDEGWGVLLLALTALSFGATLIKRWRDTGNDLWWLLTLLIPYVNLVTTGFILLAPTKKGP